MIIIMLVMVIVIIINNVSYFCCCCWNCIAHSWWLWSWFLHWPLITTTSLGKPRIISCLPFLSTLDPTLSSINHCILFSTAKNSDAFGTSWLRTIFIKWFKLHVYGKRQRPKVRFKLRISQNRKWADKNSSKQFLWIKNCLRLLI